MSFEDANTEMIPVELEDGAIVYVEVEQSGRQDVSFSAQAFQPVANAIESIVRSVATPIKKARPSKASVKFGLEIEVKQGSLVAGIVKGTGKSNLEITLEWERAKDGD